MVFDGLSDYEYSTLKNSLLTLAAQDEQLPAIFFEAWAWSHVEPLIVKYIAREAGVGLTATERVLSSLQDLRLLRPSSRTRGMFFKTQLFFHFVERAVDDPDLASFFGGGADA